MPVSKTGALTTWQLPNETYLAYIKLTFIPIPTNRLNFKIFKMFMISFLREDFIMNNVEYVRNL